MTSIRAFNPHFLSQMDPTPFDVASDVARQDIQRTWNRVCWHDWVMRHRRFAVSDRPCLTRRPQCGARRRSIHRGRVCARGGAGRCKRRRRQEAGEDQYVAAGRHGSAVGRRVAADVGTTLKGATGRPRMWSRRRGHAASPASPAGARARNPPVRNARRCAERRDPRHHRRVP
jgi:hypothetical protein